MGDRTSSPLDQTFAEKVKEVLTGFHVPGLAVAVVHGEQTYAQGYGIAKLPDTPVTPRTFFFAGSTTKAFTAGALSSVISDGNGATTSTGPKIDWTTPIHAIIPDDFVLEDDYSTRHVTLQDALSHRTGLPRHDLAGGVPGRDLRGTVRSLRHLALTAPLRTKFQYTNLMYATVGYVMEKVTGKPAESVIRERIWEPIGMRETVFKLVDVMQDPDRARRMSKGYRWVAQSESYAEVEYLDFAVVECAGATISTVLDYALWLRTMIYARPPLSPAGHAAITSSHSILSSNPFPNVETYGFGWSRRVYRNYLILHHTGVLTGYATLVLYVPQREWALVMMANISGGVPALTILAFHLIDDLLDVAQDDRLDWTLMAKRDMAKVDQDSTPATRLFPSIPMPALAPPLPFEDYAGTYTHHGYGDFPFAYEKVAIAPAMTSSSVVEPRMRQQCLHRLKAVVKRTRAISVTITHVSGESWLLCLEMGEGGEKTGFGRAQFRIGAGGQLALGLEMQGELSMSRSGEMIWLEKTSH